MTEKKHDHDPWHKHAVWIHTRIGFFTLLIINLIIFSLFNFKKYIVNLFFFGFVRFDITVHNASLYLETPSYVNCTTSPETHECKNITMALQAAELQEVVEFRSRVYDFVVYTVFMTVSLWLLATVYRTSYEKTYYNALLHNCLLSEDLMENLVEMKTEYLRANPDIYIDYLVMDRFVRKEDYGLHMFMREELVYGKTRKYYELRESFEEMMLKTTLNRPLFLFIHIIEWIHDLLRTVKMMHKRNVYHLDLQPKKIYLHWLQSTFKTNYLAWIEDNEKYGCSRTLVNLIINLDKYEYTDQRHVVLADFDHAVRSENGEVQVSRIGVPNYYKWFCFLPNYGYKIMMALFRWNTMPPECFTMEVVNAAKVDAWCIGVIAYELLSGGMLKIRASRYPPESTCEEIINDTLNKEFISTAMHTHLHLLHCFLDIRFIQKTFKNYDLDQTVFATDCWTFIAGLLRSSPAERMSIQQALRHPLMKKVRKQTGRIYYINYPL